MKKGGICIVLLIMLATGCQTAVIMDPHITTEQQTARNGSSTTVSTEEIIIYDDTTGNITLSGESLGKNRVKFSWILS
ncbi:hypothetical protein KKG82_00510, partial [Patescibacteria group bacterium]|nr:hypothetical protein [Patescibacteria group bacterium]